MSRILRVLIAVVFFLTLFPVSLSGRIIPGQVITVIMDATPDHAPAGDMITVTGFGLGPSVVRDIFLIDAKGAYRVEIVEQTSMLVRFRIPANVSPGRKRLAVALVGRAELVDQDIAVTVIPSPEDRPENRPRFLSGF